MTTTSATGADVIVARHRDRLAPARERPATDQEMRDLPAQAVAWGFPRLSPDERDDLASEVRMYLARRYGWNPPASALARPLLARRAATLYRDNRQRWADVKDASAATDADESAGDPATRTDAHVSWAGESLPAAASDWREVAEGLGVDPDGGAGLAVYAALSGYGTGADLAVVLGISQDAAWKRLERGRKQLADRFKSPAALADALADADMLDSATADRPVMADPRINCEGRWPTNGATVTAARVRLDSIRRLVRRMLDRIATTDTLPHVGQWERQPRTVALATVVGPCALRRMQPERVTVATERGEYLRPGAPTVTVARRTAPTVTDADADAQWMRANARREPREPFRPMSVAQQDADTTERVNRGALATWRASRRWDRRRRMSGLDAAPLT